MTTAMTTITTRQAAKVLGITPSTVTRWLASGRLEGYKVDPKGSPNSAYRIYLHSVNAILAERNPAYICVQPGE